MSSITEIDSQVFAKSVLIKAITFVFVFSIGLVLVVGQKPVVNGFIVGSLLDIATFFLILQGLNGFIQSRKKALIIIGIIVRIFTKTAVLIIGVTNPMLFNLWTATLGILVVEITIVAEAARIFIFGKVRLI
jgi:hypothetical protein